jgi:phosphoribosylanthranilate isomerase
MTKIKICGIKTLQDALVAAEAGADMLGFNFYPGSVRFVDLATCLQISSPLRQDHSSVQLVGVFVNSSVEEIRRALDMCALDLAQLSGDETPELCGALGDKAFKSFHGVPDIEVRPYARTRGPAFLVDGARSGSYGGTGIVPDWSAAAKLARKYPLLLAGGLNPDNVAEAVEQVRPWGVDVASGVESRPGEKDAGKISAFVEAVRSVEAESA